MIAGMLMAAWLTMVHPSPLLLEAIIDASRLIGLPRLKTMDSALNRLIVVDDFHTQNAYRSLTRKEFFASYFKINKLNQ